MADEKIEILKSLYMDKALPENAMAILSSMEAEGQLDQGLGALAQNQKFIQSLGAEKQLPQEAPGLLDFLLGVGELGLSAASGTIAEPISGLAGMVTAPFVGMDKAGKVIEAVQEIGTYQPKTESAARTATAIGEAVQPIIEKPVTAYKGMADVAAEKFGPAAGAAVMTAPALVMELIGLKGTRAAKKLALKKIINKQNISQFYDEAGRLLPDMEKAVKNSGMSLDEVADILPENIVTEAAAKPVVKQITKVPGRTGIGETARMEQLAETFQPDIEKIKRFESMEVDYLPQYVSNNPTAAAISENLKDIPGSLMDDAEKKIVLQESEAADNLIRELGGTTDRPELAMRYTDKAQEEIDKLADMASEKYDLVGKQMPGETEVDTSKILDVLEKEIKRQGGEDFLEPEELKLWKQLQADKNPTYGRLDKARKKIGNALGKKDSPFKDSERRLLSKLYDALTDTQETALLKQGDTPLLQTYLAGKHLVAQRKGIEKQMQALLGKKITADVTRKMGSTMAGLSKGNLKPYQEVLSNIPEILGPEMKREVIVSSLHSAFTSGARSQRSVSIGGFGSWWDQMTSYKSVVKQLKKDLGEDAYKRVENFALLNKDLKNAMALSKKTGRQLSTPGLFAEVDSIAARLYGEAKSGIEKIPLAGKPLGWILGKRESGRGLAADELMRNPKFKSILKYYAAGKLDTAKKMANAEKLLEKVKAYKRWKENLPERDLKDLMAVGAIGYLTGKQLGETEK